MISPSRRLFASSALVAVPIALAGCTALGGSTSSQVEQVIADIQGVLSYASPIIPLIAAFVPGAAAFVPMVETGLSVAAAIFNTISSTMTTAAAQPLVGQIVTALGGALDSADQATALIQNPAAKATATAIIAEARTVLALLATFASGVIAVVTPPAPMMRAGRALAPMHIRMVK
jgi:hypothetical protein